MPRPQSRFCFHFDQKSGTRPPRLEQKLPACTSRALEVLELSKCHGCRKRIFSRFFKCFGLRHRSKSKSELKSGGLTLPKFEVAARIRSLRRLKSCENSAAQPFFHTVPRLRGPLPPRTKSRWSRGTWQVVQILSVGSFHERGSLTSV